MKLKTRYIFITILVMVALLFFVTAPIKDSSKEESINRDIIQIGSFSIDSHSTDMNTSAKGTVFIKGNEEIPRTVQIISWIEIDPNDWGGVAFYVPKNWYVSSIVSSYPENEENTMSKDYVATWTTGDTENEWHGWVEIGRNRSYVPTGSGTGVVIIDLNLEDNLNDLGNTFSFAIEVGSDERNGVRVMGSDYESFKILINNKIE